MTEICNQCGNEYKSIGSHWSQSSSCEYPKLKEKQEEIITGLLMGDGSINHGYDSANPCIESEMISKNYLNYIDNNLGVFGNGVSIKHTAEDNAKIARNNGLNPKAEQDNYSQSYYWNSMRHPEIDKFASWYDSGKKTWPDNIDLTSTTLKHWYCCDGWMSVNNGYLNSMRISSSNEIENTQKIAQIFENSNLPKPEFRKRERSNKYKDEYMSCEIIFGVEDSKEMWDYMGEPLPDFNYKWPEGFK